MDELKTEKFVDLLFDEITAAEKAQLRREIIALDGEFCADFELSQKGLALFARAAEIDQPGEKYWQHFENDLHSAIRTEAAAKAFRQPAKKSVFSHLQTIFTASVRVPAPAFALLLAICGGAVFWSSLRPSSAPARPPQDLQSDMLPVAPANALSNDSSATSSAPLVIEKFVEVEKPVYRDRIITQKVFVKDTAAQTPTPKINRTAAAQTAKREQNSRPANSPTLNLAEFAPPEKLDVKVVKEEVSDAK